MANLRTIIRTDAENKELLLEIRDRDTGALATGYHRVKISLDALETLAAADAHGEDVVVEFRKFRWKDADASCVVKYAYFLKSQDFEE